MTRKERYQHRRVKEAEYRIRRHHNRNRYMVTEYYDGERVQLCDNELSWDDAVVLAEKLSNRDEF